MKSIETLKKRLTDNNTLFVQNESGFSGEMGFKWKEPATALEINDFEEKHNIIPPEDFKKFLKVSNGAEQVRVRVFHYKIRKRSDFIHSGR